jgi:DNA excision repair protein ERCC-3
LRPKAAQLSGKKTNADEHNAFFYSLVSTDTAEMYYSTKRQQFLIQQGYAFKVVTDLIGPQDKPQLMYSTQEKQLDLLAKVLSAGEAEAGEEVLPEDEDAIKQAHKPIGAARRTAGSITALSGADGAYLEFDAQRGGGKKKPSFQRASGAPRAVKPKNSILRERDAMLRGKKK